MSARLSCSVESHDLEHALSSCALLLLFLGVATRDIEELHEHHLRGEDHHGTHRGAHEHVVGEQLVSRQQRDTRYGAAA